MQASRLLRSEKIKRLVEERNQWTFKKFHDEVVLCYNAVEAKSANKPRYLEMIGKSNGWLRDTVNVATLFSFGAEDMSKLRDTLSNQLQLTDQSAQHTITSTPDTIKPQDIVA